MHSVYAAVRAYGGSVWFAPPPIDPESASADRAPGAPESLLGTLSSRHPEQALPPVPLSRDEILWLAEYEDVNRR